MVWFMLILNLLNIASKDACVGIDYSYSVAGQYNYYGGYYWYNSCVEPYDDYSYDVDRYGSNYLITGYTHRFRPFIPNFTRDGLYLIVNARPGFQSVSPTFYPYIGFDNERYYSSIVLEIGHILSAGTKGVYPNYGLICEVNENDEPTSFHKHLIEEINGIKKIEYGHDSFYVIVGRCGISPYYGKICLLKEDFEVKYQQQLSYSTNFCTEALDVAVLQDSGYIVVGSGHRAIIKLNSILDTIWTRSGGGTAICLANNGGFTVVSNSVTPILRGHITRYDSLGTVIWSKIDTGKQYYDVAYDSVTAKFVAVGCAGSSDSVFIVAYDLTGQKITSHTFTGTGGISGTNTARSVFYNGGGFTIVGQLYQICPIKPSYQDSLSPDAFIMSWSSKDDDISENLMGGKNTIIELDQCYDFDFGIFNFHDNEISISFTLEKSSYVNIDIYNVVGQKIVNVYSGDIIAGQHNFRYYQSTNYSKLTQGVYFVRVNVNGLPFTKSFTLFN